MTEARLNFELRSRRSSAAVVGLVVVVLVDLRVESDRGEVASQQLPTVQKVTFAQLLSDRRPVLRVFAARLHSWCAPFWGRVELLVTAGAE